MRFYRRTRTRTHALSLSYDYSSPYTPPPPTLRCRLLSLPLVIPQMPLSWLFSNSLQPYEDLTFVLGGTVTTIKPLVKPPIPHSLLLGYGGRPTPKMVRRPTKNQCRTIHFWICIPFFPHQNYEILQWIGIQRQYTNLRMLAFWLISHIFIGWEFRPNEDKWAFILFGILFVYPLFYLFKYNFLCLFWLS
jgi:hypothetical protein